MKYFIIALVFVTVITIAIVVAVTLKKSEGFVPRGLISDDILRGNLTKSYVYPEP